MGWLVPLIFLSLSIAIGVYITFPNEAPPPPVGDGWWGRGDKDAKVDESIRNFDINFSDDVLKDLRSRIRNTRYFEGIEDTQFHYGVRSEYMMEVAKYWAEKYDWRKQEQALNKYNHFLTNIEGIDVHFIHVKPNLKPGQTSKPLLLVHGWPGSFYEFYKMIALLNDGKHGGDAGEFYEIICPSIPGYAFSEAPHKTGFTTKEAARVFHKMMTRLGFSKYFIQGGDWGSAIVDHMAVIFPQHILGVHVNCVFGAHQSYIRIIIGSYFPSLILPAVDHDKVWPAMEKVYWMLQESGYFHLQMTKPDTIAEVGLSGPRHILGVHVNMAQPSQSIGRQLKVMIGSYFPSLFLPAVDHEKVWPAMDIFFHMLQESGYFHIQATKPDTVGHGLNDSPVGLAAYILEKFSTWTNSTWRDLDNGGLDNWNMDELLTNVMLYWLNGAITSSMRFYKENVALFADTNRPPVKIPSGITDCPGELFRSPEAWSRSHYQDLIQYTTMKKCGHFAAFEEPAQLATDLRNFMHKVEKGIKP